MQRNSEEALRAIIADCCGIPVADCRSEVSVFEIGVDSVVMAALVAQCEARSGCQYDDDKLIRIIACQTVGDLLAELDVAPNVASA